MYEITSRTTFPYSSVCYIEAVFPDGSSKAGSGSVVGINDVLTAHHVVYDAAAGGWATKVDVYPGADTKPVFLKPYGSFSVDNMYSRSSNWDQDGTGRLSAAEAQWDIALLSTSTNIGNTTGYMGLTSYYGNFYGLMVGYPGRGTGMMAESVYADASYDYAVYNINSGLGAGASGGPLIITDSDGERRVAGVLSSGADDDSNSTYAALYGDGTWEWLLRVMQENDGSSGSPSGGGNSSGIGYVVDGVDVDYYLNNNLDVYVAGVDPVSHYHFNGWKEKRDPNAFFDTDWYLAMNPDVAAARIDPLQHYRYNGWKEGRDPSAAFDTSSYLANNRDVYLAGICPLDHYLYSGYAEGRVW